MVTKVPRSHRDSSTTRQRRCRLPRNNPKDTDPPNLLWVSPFTQEPWPGSSCLPGRKCGPPGKHQQFSGERPQGPSSGGQRDPWKIEVTEGPGPERSVRGRPGASMLSTVLQQVRRSREPGSGHDRSPGSQGQREAGVRTQGADGQREEAGLRAALAPTGSRGGVAPGMQGGGHTCLTSSPQDTTGRLARNTRATGHGERKLRPVAGKAQICPGTTRRQKCLRRTRRGVLHPRQGRKMLLVCREQALLLPPGSAQLGLRTPIDTRLVWRAGLAVNSASGLPGPDDSSPAPCPSAPSAPGPCLVHPKLFPVLQEHIGFNHAAPLALPTAPQASASTPPPHPTKPSSPLRIYRCSPGWVGCLRLGSPGPCTDPPACAAFPTGWDSFEGGPVPFSLYPEALPTPAGSRCSVVCGHILTAAPTEPHPTRTPCTMAPHLTNARRSPPATLSTLDTPLAAYKSARRTQTALSETHVSGPAPVDHLRPLLKSGAHSLQVPRVCRVSNG